MSTHNEPFQQTALTPPEEPAGHIGEEEAFEDGYFVFPASFSQQRLWFLDQLMPGSAQYNIPYALRLTGQLDVAALEASLQEIICRHEALRTTFAVEEEELLQVIAVDAPFTLPLIDLSALPAAERETHVLAAAREEAGRPFDLATGPLIRATLLREGEGAHILLLTMHHIISDGWSMGVFVREVAALYGAFVQEQESPLPDLPIQYADFADWQRDFLQGEALAQQLTYWREKLGGELPLLQLPSDRPRPQVRSQRGAVEPFTLSPELTAGLHALSRRENATLFMTLLTAFKTLLSRYTGQEDILVGTPIAGRKLGEIEGLIGFFVNTLVLRTDLSDATFRDGLARVRQTALEAFANQDVPFEKLVEELQPERNMSHTPLFQTLFVLQNAPMSALRLPGLTLEPLELPVESAKFDLTLTLVEQGGGISGQFQYNTDLFDPATVRRMIGHWQTLLEAVLRDPEQSLAQLPLLTEQERRQVLTEWNKIPSATPAPAGVCVHELFEQQAARTPHETAVVFEEHSLTYDELNRRANRLAHLLQKAGVGPESRVGLFLERSAEMVVGVLGILKAGAAYVPLDPKFPPDRLAYMLEDSAAPVLVTLERMRGELPPHNARVVCLDGEELRTGESQVAAKGVLSSESTADEQDSANLHPLPETNPVSGARPDNLVYVIYTSGSTGKPKGVLIEHRQLLNYLHGIQERLPVEPGLHYALMQPLAVDASKTFFYLPLLTGGCLHVISEERSLDAKLLADYNGRHRIDWLKLAPSHLSALQSIVPPADLMPRQLLMLGGEGAPFEWVKKLQSYAPDCLIINQYGPTETTVGITSYQLKPGRGDGQGGLSADHSAPDKQAAPSAPTSALTPLGRPLPNVELYILDTRLQPVPVGVVGELYAGGPCVARGYLNRPDLTAERFLPHPFSSDPEARVYRTGDQVRYLPNGDIEFLGRADDQVKIRGFRIELGEIQTLLAQHPDVREALITTLDADGEKRLVGYAVPASNRQEAATPAALRTYMRDRLPEHMVPSAFVLLPELPRTRHGKVDRKALPVPETFQTSSDQTYTAPRTETEEKLAAIWAAVLRVDRVGAHDNFFTLGGHSLLATQLMARVNLELAVELPLRHLFEAPTVAGLGALIDERRQAGETVELPPIQAVSRQDPLPLSFAQERLWFLDRLQPGQTAYHMPYAVRLTGDLNLTALEQSFQAILDRQEALRTTFALENGQPVQVIAPHLRMPFTVRDFTALPEAEREQKAAQAAQEEAGRPFDLSRGPLIRASLLKLSGTEHLLLLNMHHIISDGWSMGLFLREMTAHYHAFTTGQKSPLPALPVQYADFAVWQRERLQGDFFQKQLHYWQQKLQGELPVLQLPADRPRPAVQTSRGGRVNRTVPHETLTALQKLSSQEGATLYMTLLAAFNTLLFRHTHQDDLLIGTPVANRRHPQVEEMIGFFVNTLVLRTSFTGDMLFRELLQTVKDTVLEAFDHQDLPFEKVVEAVQPERSRSHSPLFQVLFTLQNTPREAVVLPDISFEPLTMDNGTAKLDLALSAMETEEGLQCSFEYNADLFDEATVERMADHFDHLLQAIVNNPESALHSLNLMGQEERDALLALGKGTADRGDRVSVHVVASDAADGVPDGTGAATNAPTLSSEQDLLCVPHLFLRQAARTPDAVALQFQGVPMTYRELHERASQLALFLQRQNVRPDGLVAICTERSHDMIIGLLGILLAGAAYLPIDPEYPAERIAYMLEDSGASLLLTQAHLQDRLPEHQAHVVRLDADWARISEEGSGEPDLTGLRPDHLAYVIYTSGSTGKPKGVQIEHRAMRHMIEARQKAFDFDTDTRVLQFITFSFDVSVAEIFNTMLAGGILYIEKKETLLSLPNFLTSLMSYRINTMYLPPSFMSLLTEAGADVPHLQTIFVGGEACTPAALAYWSRGRRLFNEYGPTETAVVATYAPVDSDSSPNNIGRPFSGVDLCVLDAQGQLVPLGVPGELHIGGGGVGCGYLNRPDLTAEKFIPHPLAAEQGTRLYKTGDLVRWLPDGTLEFLGRIDQQVKLRGFRIELGEIEQALHAHDSVRDAVVVVHEEGSGDKKLIAYWTASEGVATADLRAYLQTQLPEHMVPAAFVKLETLPLTPNGKVDRNTLSRRPVNVQTQENARIAPRTPLETELAHVWEEVLDTRPIGVRDNFFHLGGHSLLAVRLTAQLEQRFGLQVPLSTLFHAPTIEQLAVWIGESVQTQATGHIGSSTGDSAKLIPLQHATPASNEPFFCIHPIGGGVMSYSALSQALGPEQPFYALQAPGLDGEQPPHATVEDMAASYLAEVRRVQPKGPYRLGGWSFGGLVAYEMAHQLRAQGEIVTLLALFDTFAPSAPQQPPEAEHELTQHILADFTRDLLTGLQPALNLADLPFTPERFQQELQHLSEKEALRFIRLQATQANLLPADLSEAALERLYRVFRAHYLAARRYRPQPATGALTLFAAEDRFQTGTVHQQGTAPASPTNAFHPQPEASASPAKADLSLGWLTHAPGAEVIALPGNHYTLLQPPCVDAVAAHLAARLAKGNH